MMGNQKGQTMVEYVLLITVAVSLVLTFYKSSVFQKYFGNNGSIGQKMKKENEFGYRHAYLRGAPEGEEPERYPASQHPSYYNAQANDTHFFGPVEPYQ